LTALIRTLAVHRQALVLVALLSGVACGSDSPTTPTTTTVPIEPPRITCPSSQSLISPFAAPIPVVYGTASVSGGVSPVTTSCTPPSGSTFALGRTTVTCTATDAQQRTSSCTLSVTVSAPPRISMTKFAAFGDSITRGEDGTYALTTLTDGVLRFVQDVFLVGFEYPTVLLSELQARYTLQSGFVVANLGNPGESAGPATTLSRFSSQVVGGGYQAVLIMEGSNDVYYAALDANPAPGIQAGIDGLQAMIRRAKSANIKPFLATIPPMDKNSPCIPQCRGFAQDLVPGFNTKVRALAALESVPLVDVNAAFNGDLSLLSTDGLHPNKQGYQVIADTFFATFKATLESSSLAGIGDRGYGIGGR
jgi:lysophospholipase L1-like esterase